jgi:hypothetical protein
VLQRTLPPKKKKKKKRAGCQYLIAVILATWEAEIRRIMVQVQPRQIVFSLGYLQK